MTAERWKITHNFIDNYDKTERNTNVIIKDPVTFILYDDDGNIYFQGEMSKKKLCGADPFEPLDMTQHTYGCVGLLYYENGSWKNL